jgi:hypothetical protein
MLTHTHKRTLHMYWCFLSELLTWRTLLLQCYVTPIKLNLYLVYVVFVFVVIVIVV